MCAAFTRIDFPEIFLGFVAPVGVEMTSSLKHFRTHFERFGYNVIPIKVTDVFEELEKVVPPKEELVTSPPHLRLERYIKYGNQVREYFEDDALLAGLTIASIVKKRVERAADKVSSPEKNVFFLHQFKRREEIDLLRSIYGRVFFQVSIYSRTGARVEHLAKAFARAENSGTSDPYRSLAEAIVQTDQNEAGNTHGQRVSAIFHNGDLILNADAASDAALEDQICRFVNLLFGSNRISPTRDEYGMFVAKSAALRTLDLSRQVGAAIFSSEGEILTMGSNEVPKATGGTYWCDDPNQFDDRDYVREYDSNDQRKRELLFDLVKALGLDADAVTKPAVNKSQFMDALEYGRIIHAEMSAICDAARLGRSLADATLYTTTFPCHMCAKHVVAAGIAKVIFLEPYPKSLSAALHGDSVKIEGADRGRYQGYPAVDFMHFHGISHRRYRELFERTKRKDDDGKFLEWHDPHIDEDTRTRYPRPIVDLQFPFYLELEKRTMQAYTDLVRQLIEDDGQAEADGALQMEERPH
ncbi:anti-phage dCTP deaminase [Bradyrhizobium sp. BEA-2-5]|uniref:anti-phage dCTP deaminase n=1 Tax=Bradyrhizobium sp. BEA-2-5 TaxID=3080015 RepID=UPI00293F0A45|nr:anti-phage dCTP deaminase [Bradyrhizobium sp. BEA-2-5]WOH78267.1 anti-phage dCTP deaminase [Bradyrhizobium sp. BEA-2-5]